MAVRFAEVRVHEEDGGRGGLGNPGAEGLPTLHGGEAEPGVRGPRDALDQDAILVEDEEGAGASVHK